jgi:hypothetical protein
MRAASAALALNSVIWSLSITMVGARATGIQYRKLGIFRAGIMRDSEGAQAAPELRNFSKRAWRFSAWVYALFGAS